MNSNHKSSSNQKAVAALLAVFPSRETFLQFCGESDNSPIVDSIIDFAVRNGVIPTPDRESLSGFIQSHSGATIEDEHPKHLNFEGLLDRKDELLRLNLSVRALTDRINALLAEQRIGLPNVSNSMLTRLKKEPADTLYKQNVLRSLAFWLGHERKELGQVWNYEVLVRLCRDSRQQDQYREGVRVGFALSSRGDFIDQDVVNWLKKALKQYMEQKLDHFNFGRWGKVRSYDITTLYIDFPKEDAAEGPAAYRQCLRSAIFLAHQIAIRWALSDFCTKKRFLAIGIVAGEFAGLETYLHPLLSAKLPGDPVIRVSDYARQCLLINDIRVILGRQPTETALFSGEALSIWPITTLWSFIYFDFVPDLLKDRILGNDPGSVQELHRLLWFPDEAEPEADMSPNAVKTFLRSPHNSLLGIEIAKTLYFRRRLAEAVEILRILLSIDPIDLVARTLRMVLFRNMALEAPSFPVAKSLFRMAEQEACFILDNCPSQSEDFYCECAVVFLAQGLTVFRRLRQNSADLPEQERQAMKQGAITSLNRAEELLEKGMTVSPSGLRASYLLGSIRILQAILNEDEEIFTDPARPVDGRLALVKEQAGNLLRQRGYTINSLDNTLEMPRYDPLQKLLLHKIRFHTDSISLQAYRPTICFTSAVTLWDFFPVRTVAIARKVVRFLREAIDAARAVEHEDVCIYSFSRTYGELMPVGEFIGHMEKALAMVERIAGGDLAGRADEEILASDEKLSGLLMTLNF